MPPDSQAPSGPETATRLHQQAVDLAMAGHTEAALAPARDAALIRHALVLAGHTEQLRNLAASLGNLCNMLAETGREAEIPGVWEPAITGLHGHEQPRRVLTVAYARYQLAHGQPAAGAHLASTLLTSRGTPDRAAVQARELLHRFLAPTVRDWYAAPGWDSSRVFLRAHPELLAEAVPDLLAGLSGDAAARTVALHRAILMLAAGPSGPDSAYGCLTEPAELKVTLDEALTTRDPRVISACGTIEVLTFGRPFTGSIHTVLARLLQDPLTGLSGPLVAKLTVLASAAAPAERRRVVAELTSLLPGPPSQDRLSGLIRLIEPA